MDVGIGICIYVYGYVHVFVCVCTYNERFQNRVQQAFLQGAFRYIFKLLR